MKASPTHVVAIFDIGKTNKKFLLFNGAYEVVSQYQTQFEQCQDDDGDPCEDLSALQDWVFKKIDEVLSDEQYHLEALNFSTYGASFVHINEAGEAVSPLYDYQKIYPQELLDQFYETHGKRKKIALETASPSMGMLNAGLQLYWLKFRKPERFNNIHSSLFLPQYLSFLFTKKKVAELTSIGCHTLLWDMTKKAYHQWVRDENIMKVLLPPQKVDRLTEATYNDDKIQVGTGIHDSSAALVPYLMTANDPFILVSTGTWSITFNPFNESRLTYQELQKDCLCYINMYGEKVKSSRFFLGKEYSYQKNRMAAHFGIEKIEDRVEISHNLLHNILEHLNAAKKLKLGKAHRTGPYPQEKAGEWSLEQFSGLQEAYHQLMVDLVSIQAECIRLVKKNNSQNLIVTGGFSKNEFFVKLLANFFPEKHVYTSHLSNASALGAAMAIDKDAKDRGHHLQHLLKLKKHEPIKNIDITTYGWANPVYS